MRPQLTLQIAIVYTQGFYQSIPTQNCLFLDSELCHNDVECCISCGVHHGTLIVFNTEGSNEIKITKIIHYI